MKTRAQLREKGQFWTPDWIAESMVRYALGNGSAQVFDPAYGMGAFFVAAKNLEKELGRKINLHGTDIDPELIEQIRSKRILEPKALKNLKVQDFVELALDKKYDSVVVNPPYIRHHRISPKKKQVLRKIAAQHLGKELDGRAGLHVYFLILSLLSLKQGGRLSFIVSSDICEGVFAGPLWNWIAARYQIEGVLTFSAKASPFPGVDTNPIVFFIKNARPIKSLSWARANKADARGIAAWIEGGFDPSLSTDSLRIVNRALEEAICTGLSRKPQTERHQFILGDFIHAMRGIATGNNNYFFLDKETVKKHKIPESYLVPAVGRTRDVVGNILDEETFETLREKGRPYYLLYINQDDRKSLPKSIQNYLAYGEEEGVNKTPLISARRVWFKMERREPPPLLFAYLGRRSSRFILNKARAVPLNGFLCIYPKNDSVEVDKLFKLVSHATVLENLPLVGKSYGSGAVKVEPRAIERLPIPGHLIESLGLAVPARHSSLLY